MAIPLITLCGVVPRLPDSPFTEPLDWQINQGEVWGVTGKNGSGKSLLADLVRGKTAIRSGEILYDFSAAFQKYGKNVSSNRPPLPSQGIRKIEFNSLFSLINYQSLFYQQRFNHSEYDDIPRVADLLPDEMLEENSMQVFKDFGLADLAGRKLIQLSSGELRKLLIVKSLCDKPSLLIFDNPFIGLDRESKQTLNNLFSELPSYSLTQLMFLAPDQDELPDCVTHILHMDNCTINKIFPFRQSHSRSHADNVKKLTVRNNKCPSGQTVLPSNKNDIEVVSMKNVDIAYGNQIIQKGLNWTVHQGERWAMVGPNGSGKSTLLSYIYADNPQAYAKNISLFGKKRGTGESIWEIKRRIGFSSSELHLYYRQNVNCAVVVASGFFDSVGLYRKCGEVQLLEARKIMETLGIGHLEDRSFLKVSSGEQRLLLFARAMVKDPELLILDEPFHGLDPENKARCLSMAESFMANPSKTLIFVSHKEEEIPCYIDHCFVLRGTESRFTTKL